MPSCGVRPSVCLSRSLILSKRINIYSKFFVTLGSHTFLVFLYQTLWQYSEGDSQRVRRMQVGLVLVTNRDFRYRSMTAEVRTTTATVHRAVYRTEGDASVNLVYHNQHGRPRRRKENRIYLCTQR